MVTYKQHFACFNCRKTFKRKLLKDLKDTVSGQLEESVAAKCPQCGDYTANMGLDFKSPPMNDIKSWKVLSGLFEIGEIFHSCGCSGPGYRPKDKYAMRDYLSRLLKEYSSFYQGWSQSADTQGKEKQEALVLWADRIEKIKRTLEKF